MSSRQPKHFIRTKLGSKLINSCGFISKCEFLAGMTTNLSEFRRRARTRRCALRGLYADFLGFHRFDRNSGAAQLMSLDPSELSNEGTPSRRVIRCKFSSWQIYAGTNKL